MSTLSGGQAADNVSIGVYKSTDGGGTWFATGLTFNKSDGTRITRLLIDPTNSSILYAAVNTGNPQAAGAEGIYKSIDGGTNWTKKTGGFWGDMEFKPGTSGATATIYASSMGNYNFSPSFHYFTEVTYSNDGGDNWSTPLLISNDAVRGELAVTAANPAIVYLVVANGNGGLDNIYKSTDSGIHFAPMLVPAPAGNDGKSFFGYESDGSGDNVGQGSYDICIAASPIDENEVYIGGVNTWKYTTATGWKCVTHWSTSPPTVVHADKHAQAYQPGTNVLFEGNDGGIYKTNDGGTTWTDLTDGMVISQIYRIGVSQSDASIILTGLQDNGSKKYIGGPSNWVDVNGGDGMECIVDFNNATSYMYVTYVEGEISRNTDGFSTQVKTKISENIGTAADRKGAWVTPYIMDPTNSATLYAGYAKVWKTTDHGDTWGAISQDLSPGQYDKLRSLAIAPSNTNVLYTADPTNMWKTTNGGTSDWTDITANLPTLSNSITYIAVKNDDPNTVWFTVGGYTSRTESL